MNAAAPHAESATAPQASVPQQILHSMRETFAPDVPEALAAAAETLRAASPMPQLAETRAAAWGAFERLGIPGTKHEDFSYVSSADLKANLNRAPEETAAPRLEGSGFEFAPPPEAARDAVAAETDAPAALAMAFATHPAALRVPKGGKAVIDVRLPAAGKDGEGRSDQALYLRVEENAEATVTLAIEGLAAAGFLNAVASFSLAPGARLKVLQQDAPEGVQLLKLRFAVEKDARAELLAVSTGSRLARLAIEADLLAAGAEIDLRGAAAPAAQGRVHRHLRLRHASPDCRSSQLFKAVVPAAGRSSVDGTVIVDRGAQRTDARQLLQHLLLSPEGRADAKPRLLIHADDVKCSHGATVGKTDPAQKFYLLSRGLDARTADRLLTQAFLGEALELFPEEATAAVRERLMDAVTGIMK